MKKVILLVFLFLLMGCVSQPTPVTEPGVIVFTPQATEQSRVKIVAPDLQRKCPLNAEVPINQLGLPDDIKLLVVDGNQELGDTNQPLISDVMFFSGGNATPGKLNKVASAGDDLVTDLLLSPDGQWLAISHWQKGSRQVTIWISSIDGQKQWRLVNVSTQQMVSWVSNSELLITGVPNESDYEGHIYEEDMRPLLSLNPFTLKQRELAPLPHDAIYEYGSYHSRNGNPYSMYHMKDTQETARFLYDYVKGSSTRIFPWIDFSDQTAGIGIEPNGLYFVAHRNSLGVDFALDLDMEQISENQSYNDLMKNLTISNAAQKIEISLMLPGLTESDILIATVDPADPEKPTPIYFYHDKTSVLKDYCLSLRQVRATFSPDEQFVAFTVPDEIDEPGYHILVLNLKTGYYSKIPNMRAIGFGKGD